MTSGRPIHSKMEVQIVARNLPVWDGARSVPLGVGTSIRLRGTPTSRA
jgi:hypothetical protein